MAIVLMTKGVTLLLGMPSILASSTLDISIPQTYSGIQVVENKDSLNTKKTDTKYRIHNGAYQKATNISQRPDDSSDKDLFTHDNKHDFKFNKDAVKFIDFDFTSNEEEHYKPQLAPLKKSWMDFQVDLSVPKSLIDTTKIRKPKSYHRMLPYSMWTPYGENPVYDVLVFGNEKRFKMHMNIDLSNIQYYGKKMAPIVGRTYHSSSMNSSVVIADLDFIGFLYETFNKQGRLRKHNRKHANAWKTYNTASATLALELSSRNSRTPNYGLLQNADMQRELVNANPDVHQKGDGVSLLNDSTYNSIDKGESGNGKQHENEKRNGNKTRSEEGSRMVKEGMNNDSKGKKNKIYRRSQVITSHDNGSELKELPNSMEDLYKYIRQKQEQDSIKRKEIFRKDKAEQNIYELEQQQRKLKEQQN